MKKIKNTLAVLFCLAFFTTGYAQTIEKAKLDLLFDRLLEKNKAMGSIAISKDGNVLYTRSFGYGQITETMKKPLTENTEYRISSITKTYTAVMIFQLVEEMKLNLGDHLDKFFPQIPNASKITIAQILSHRSGIPDLNVENGWRMQARTHEEVIEVIAKGKPIFEPGSQLQYSNTGYVLLGYVLEKVTGKPYQEILKERIISKIGLTHTYMGIGNTNIDNNESLAYTYEGTWKEAPEINFSVPAGAGAILSTPADMIKFIQALFDLKLVSKNSLDQMKTMRDGEGMGLVQFSFAGRTLYGNTGGSNVSGAWLAYEPNEKVAMAYTTNAKIVPVAEIVAGIFNIYWNQPYEVPTFDAVEISPEILDQYVGVYGIAGAPVKMTVTRNGATIAIQNGANTIPLEAITTNKFKLAYGVTVEFDAAKKQMTIKRPQGEGVFTKEN
ncbi:MAG: class beta-lactamase-related serine hydrolase [Chitinophagaceae bacterium]|nr:class beta-lactamase-related serine hydrolase [Chitinophagaceae bacterium]